MAINGLYGGTLFRREYFFDGFFAKMFRAQTVNGLGRERDNFARWMKRATIDGDSVILVFTVAHTA